MGAVVIGEDTHTTQTLHTKGIEPTESMIRSVEKKAANIINVGKDITDIDIEVIYIENLATENFKVTMTCTGSLGTDSAQDSGEFFPEVLANTHKKLTGQLRDRKSKYLENRSRRTQPEEVPVPQV